MKKIYLLLLAIFCSIGMSWGENTYHVFVCPADVWGSNYDGNGVSINYQKTDDSWSGVQTMTLTSFTAEGKKIYGYEMDVNPNTSLKALQFVNHNDYYGAGSWGNSNDHVYHGYIDNAHKWTDLPATRNASAVYLVGTFNSWTNEDANYKLTKADGNHWYGTFNLNGANSNYEFKVFAIDEPSTWGYQFSGNGYYFNNTNTIVNQLWSNNNNDQIVPRTSTGQFPIFVEYYGEYNGKGRLEIKQQYTLNVSNVGWASFCVPFNATIPANVEVFYASNVTNTSIVLTQITDILPANTGVLVRAAAGNYTFVGTTEDATSVTNKMNGTIISTAMNGNDNYVLAEVSDGLPVFKLYALSDGDNSSITLGANKAYLPASLRPAASPAPGRISFIIEGETVATNMENVEANDNVQKFIENGKLVIVKDGIRYNALGQIVR